MREVIPSENRPRPLKFDSNNRENVNPSKLRSASSWGSHIVKGFAEEKKTKSQTAVPAKKMPLSRSNIANKQNPPGPLQCRVKRSLMGDLACTVSSTQVYPQPLCTHRTKPSRDLFLELESLRSLLRESKEREAQLQEELSECRRCPRVLELEGELEKKKTEAGNLVKKIGLLEAETNSLSEQLLLLNSDPQRPEEVSKDDHGSSKQNLEIEVLQLRRQNKELQLQKRDLACRLSSLESQLATFGQSSESDIISKIKAESCALKHTNEDLCRQVEGLQMNRLNEVEELVYLRWVNSCLRNELRSSCVPMNSVDSLSPDSITRSNEPISSSPFEVRSPKRLNLTRRTMKWPTDGGRSPNSDCRGNILDKPWLQLEEFKSPKRRHSLCGTKCSLEDVVLSKRRQSDGYMHPKDIETESELLKYKKYGINKATASLDVQRRALRIPNPPPRPTCILSLTPKEDSSEEISPPRVPPPPPPPPPSKFSLRNTGMVQRAPQVVEFYHSLMRRDSKKDPSNGGIYEASDVVNVRSSMIDEIENRSSHLLAIKADVETQGEFVNSLIKEVNNAFYQDIEDVAAFVKWLDDELSHLVDERAVLKQFDWPEKKADTLREAAFSYRDLKKLESDVSYYEDNPQVSCDAALRKMVTLSEKMERTVYNLLRSREQLMHHCKEFQIPTNWMLDNGILNRIKFGSMKLAKKYMKRVAMELQSKGGLEKDPALDYMLLQGVRFAFRIHQFAGGFDAETMHAFEELRNLACGLNKM